MEYCFLAHGCSHSHTDWFDKTTEDGTCPNCLGLPEEKAIVKMAWQMNVVVVTISSLNRQSKCWNLQEDGPRVADTLSWISLEYPNVPILAFGATSGGSFVSQLQGFMHESGTNIKMNGFISQIAVLSPSTDTTLDCDVYITMNRDKVTDGRPATRHRL